MDSPVVDKMIDLIEYDPEIETASLDDPYSFDKVAKVVPILQCSKCDFVNVSFAAVRQHYKIHECFVHHSMNSSDAEEVNEVLICGICFDQFESEDTLKIHMIEDHGCRIIKNTTENTETANESKNEMSDEYEVSDTEDKNNIRPVAFRNFKMILKRTLTYKCPMKACCYKFETKEKLELHVKCHASSDPERYYDFKCIKCSKEVKLWRNCTDHMWKEHKVDIDMLGCPMCSYKSHTSVKVWRHMRSHPKWKPKFLKNNWSSSKERNNSTSSRWYTQKTCQICSRRFANAKTLSKHVKAVHNKIKPFICNVCGRKSARKSTWIVHMRQHTGEKPLQCKICPYRASDPSVIKTHEKRHTKEGLYKCGSCNYTSIQSSALKFHVKSNHPEEFKKLSCDQCSYISVSKMMLEAHKKDHKKGLIQNEDSMDPPNAALNKTVPKPKLPEKPLSNVEISSDCFLPLESTDSIAPDPSIDTGGVTIPAHSEDTQFPSFINS